MSSAKVTLIIARDVLRRARQQVRHGRARSLSTFVTEAIAEKLRREALGGILDAMDERFGSPNEDDSVWARQVLMPSSLTR
jgi:hypothetical protein